MDQQRMRVPTCSLPTGTRSSSELDHKESEYFRCQKKARLLEGSEDDDIDMVDDNHQQVSSILTSSTTITSQQVMRISFAALFPLSFFVAKLVTNTGINANKTMIVLKCKFCKRFGHLPLLMMNGHPTSLTFTVENDRDVGNWYDSRLFSHHLGGCLNCSVHQLRVLGTRFGGNSHAMAHFCPPGNRQILSRYLYQHLLEQQQHCAQDEFSPMLPKDQLLQCENVLKNWTTVSESTMVDFYCPTLV